MGIEVDADRLARRLDELAAIGRTPAGGVRRLALTPAERAAHDAMVVARLAPAGMVFVRSAGGRSHAPEELTTLEDLAAGTRVLAGTLARLASPRDYA